jgi:hypothetical protein
VANGGTNASTFTSGSVVFAGSSGTYTQDNSNLFFDNTNDRLGIATNTPTQKLHVVGNAYITSKIGVGLDPFGIGGAVLGLQTTNNNTEYFRGYNASGSTRFGWDLVSDEAVLTLFGINNVVMRTNGNSYLNGGNVGIGTTTPAVQFHTTSNVRFAGLTSITDLRTDADGDLFNGSDFNLKNSIDTINFGLQDVLKLKPVQFNWNDISRNLNEYKNLGFIAQDVMDVIPNAASSMGDGDMQVDYNAIVATLTKAIQEQQALIKALEQRIINLENK